MSILPTLEAEKKANSTNENPKQELKKSDNSSKLELIEKRLKALKISLRFSKDKAMVEKRIKALGISLKSLSK
jgi:predicted enzyme involved in methoxymalonyl-ACP biosynthesis